MRPYIKADLFDTWRVWVSWKIKPKTKSKLGQL